MSSYPVGLIIFLLLISLAHFLTPVLLIGGRNALSLKQKKKVGGGVEDWGRGWRGSSLFKQRSGSDSQGMRKKRRRMEEDMSGLSSSLAGQCVTEPVLCGSDPVVLLPAVFNLWPLGSLLPLPPVAICLTPTQPHAQKEERKENKTNEADLQKKEQKKQVLLNKAQLSERSGRRGNAN